MDLHVMLPWELEEEILSRLPPKSLVRCRAVSKRWNSLFNDKSFINKHLCLSRPQFIFMTKSKIYSIDIIDQSIDLRELHSSCRDLNSEYGNINTWDDLLFCEYPFDSKKGIALWNPWLRHVNWIKLSVDRDFEVFGLGYDNSRPQKVHKILLYLSYFPQPQKIAIYECASQALRFIDTPGDNMHISEIDKRSHVLSLSGNLYWISYNYLTGEYFIRSFDFTREIFKPFCLFPFQVKHIKNEALLAVWKGDRLSLLKQCYLPRNEIEIWVMENKIDVKEEVVWINLMTLTASNLPNLSGMIYRVSYFIYDKTLFMCCDNGSRDPYVPCIPCIYIAKGDMCNMIPIGSGQDGWFTHSAYVPNLNSVPFTISD
ncbi:unnamed protein product [Eruca vesicaria subsp. sativa]|uniref:F-box domain-containing protein n=1 Tax=Eruca vesicaria subsp. sativa TaxID=29727 RepID=A0ABC8KRR6_ERUVS|nr:unnamed protein product [Eruca vesicaria subsp. sativa]